MRRPHAAQTLPPNCVSCALTAPPSPPPLLLQERANPQLLINSPSRRRRVAEGSGRGEQDVAEMMSAFTQMKAQASNMSKLMRLGQGAAAEGLVQCLARGACQTCL